MNLFVSSPIYGTSSMEIASGLKVSALKHDILKLLSIPENEQTLTYNGYLLEMNRSLEEYKIVDKSMINLSVRLDFNRMFEINVLIPSGKVISVSVAPITLVEALKTQLNELEHIVRETHELAFNGFYLEDICQLGDYGIIQGSTVTVLRRISSKDDYESNDLLRVSKQHRGL